jgi:hypothetical protein
LYQNQRTIEIKTKTAMPKTHITEPIAITFDKSFQNDASPGLYGC